MTGPELTPPDVEQPAPLIPPAVRTAAYVVGLAAGSAATALAAGGQQVAAAWASAVATAGLGVAFGYRPTRS